MNVIKVYTCACVYLIKNEERRPEWKRLKQEVTNEISKKLHLMIIFHAQEINVCMNTRGKPKKVQKFTDIGQCWADDGSIINASKIIRVTNTQFEESNAYKC